jgi:hypothetical protein
VELYCGPDVIRDRVALDKAGYTVDKQTFEPVGSTLRFTNFTAHPSQTPGAIKHSGHGTRLRHGALTCQPVCQNRAVTAFATLFCRSGKLHLHSLCGIKLRYKP